jgi:hypothetical protein
MLRFVNWLADKVGATGPQTTGPDGFRYPNDDPLAAEFTLLDGLLAETRNTHAWQIKLGSLNTAKALLDSPPKQQLRLLIAAFRRLREAKPDWNTSDSSLRAAYALRPLISTLLRRKLPFDMQSIRALIELAGSATHTFEAKTSIAGMLRAVERFAEDQPLDEETVAALQKFKKQVTTTGFMGSQSNEDVKLAERFDALLGKKALHHLEPGEQWSDAVMQMIQSAGPSAFAWNALLQHAFEITGSKPTKPWLKKAKELIEGIGQQAFVEGICTWFALVGQPGRPRGFPVHGDLDTSTLINPRNADALKGLVWAAGTLSSAGEGTGPTANSVAAATGTAGPVVARLIGQLAEACFKKIPNVGARCPKVGNACLAVLGSMNDDEAIAQLSRLRLKLKMPSMRRLLDKAVAAAGRQRGMSAEDLEEISVPTYGLTGSGELRRDLGGFTALVQIVGSNEVELKWLTSDGKPQKAVPAKVKQEQATEIKDLQQAVKDIRKMLPAQSARIERLLAREREWDVSTWRERYLDHPLLATITRRLIWQFSPGSEMGIWRDGRLVDAEDREINLPSDARVRLWHPISASPEVTLAWRRWLERHEVTQPIKQAHREIYLLTDAERATDTYSNRFAAHILRQHQFTALCQQRGWTYRLQSAHFDAANTPTLQLPWCDMRVEFWVDVEGQTESTDHFISMYVTTDQVRFYSGPEPEPMRLERIPPVVFSEVMRDVDLFVGVCSVGNDPQWHDAGDQRNFGPYWQDYSFGELNATANTRKQVLETLVPRLKIASRCSLRDRYLIVRGDLRMYKIHLGSANILMEPNDQYLCIVPGRGPQKTGKVYLPFEGDRTLDVIISKAFLLAEDKKITDPTILNQIRK